MFSNFLVKTSTKTKPFKAHIESEVVLDVKSQTNWLVFFFISHSRGCYSDNIIKPASFD